MELFKLVGSIMVDSGDAQKEIKDTETKASSLKDNLAAGISTAMEWGGAIAGAAATAGAALVQASKDVAADLDVIDKASQRMGISAESYQELSYAAGLCGVEMSTMEQAAKKLEGTDMSFDDAIASIMSLDDEAARTQAAIDLFGESVAYKMAPLLAAGGEAFAEMQDEAHELGLVMSDEEVAAGATMNDSFSKIEQSIQAMKTAIVVDLMPAVQKILDWVVEHMPEIRDTIDEVMKYITPVVEGVIDTILPLLDTLWAAITPVIDGILPLLEPALALVQAAVESFIGVIQATVDLIMPYIEPIVTNITALLEGFFALIDGDFTGFIDGVTTFITGSVDVFLGLGEDLMNALWDGLKNVWGSVGDWFGDMGEQISGWFSDIGSGIAGWWDGLWGGGDGNSHASGLAEVPYDGYRATLHKGETVLNEQDTNKLQAILNGETAGSGEPVNITVQNVLDGKVIGEFSYQYNRRKARALGI